jgi:hypothetical protein
MTMDGNDSLGFEMILIPCVVSEKKDFYTLCFGIFGILVLKASGSLS